MNQIAQSTYSSLSIIFDNPVLLLKRIAVFLCLMGIVFLVFELCTSNREHIGDLLDNHTATPLLSHFFPFLISEVTALLFALCIILINTVSFIHMMLASGNGHIIFLCILSAGSFVSLIIYLTELGGKQQVTFGLAGTGGLSLSFGFVSGFSLAGKKVKKSMEGVNESDVS